MSYALRVNKQCKHFDKYHESWLFKLAIYSRFFNNHRQCQIVRFLRWEIEEEENAPWYQTWVKYLILCLGFKLCLFLNSKSVNWARIMPAEEGDHIFGSPANSPTEKKKSTSAAKQTNIFSFSLFLGRPVQWMENVIYKHKHFSRWPLISPGHFDFSSLFTLTFNFSWSLSLFISFHFYFLLPANEGSVKGEIDPSETFPNKNDLPCQEINGTREKWL